MAIKPKIGRKTKSKVLKSAISPKRRIVVRRKPNLISVIPSLIPLLPAKVATISLALFAAMKTLLPGRSLVKRSGR